jgi:hypothetical protein
MKSFFSTLILIFSLVFIPQVSLAQTNCSVINTEDDYTECCVGVNAGSKACTEYQGMHAGGDTQGGGSGETMSVNNNYGQCLTYRWNGTAWILVSTENHPCGGANGGPTSQCSVVDDLNYENCCINQTGNSAACSKYLGGGGMPPGDGTLNSNFPLGNTVQNGTPTPGSIAATPQASSDQLKSCNAISFDSILDILIWLKCIIGAAIIPLIFTLAFLFFLWGMVMYIRGSDDVKKREESKKFIYWGIIGLTVMISVWGIVKIVNTTFGFGNTVPTLQTDYLKTKN